MIYTTARDKNLAELKAAIKGGTWEPFPRELFAGAGIIVKTRNYRVREDETATYVLTDDARRVSSLIWELEAIFTDVLDCSSKYYFYGSLGDAANEARKTGATKDDVLVAMVARAEGLMDELGRSAYFAYGSNMSVEQMAKRCPDARNVRVAHLDGYRLALDQKGFATVEEAPGQTVWGALWAVSPDDLGSLDGYEGLDTGCYKRVKVTVTCGEEGPTVPAIAYVSLREKNQGRRANGYLRRVFQAGTRLGLPREYLKQIRALGQNADVPRG